jgi:hypothetical protein
MVMVISILQMIVEEDPLIGTRIPGKTSGEKEKMGKE